MASEKPLTITNLITALKEAGFVTKKDLTKSFSDFWQQVLEPVMVTKDELKSVKSELKEDIKVVRRELKTEIRKNGRQIANLKTDTISRKEFDGLKEKVDRHYPAN